MSASKSRSILHPSALGRAAAAVLLAGSVSACSSMRDFSSDDAVSGLTSALTIATAGVGIASAVGGGGGYSGGGYRPSSPSGSPPYRAPSGNGYSQKGAFDDCAALAASMGPSAAQQQAICRQRSANMGSLH